MSWFKCKVAYEKANEGTLKDVTEGVLVQAETFTDAEGILADVVFDLNRKKSFTVKSIQKMNIYDLYLDHKSERFYKCKVGFITLDEKKGEEKVKYVAVMVQADTVELALQELNSKLGDTLSDYVVHTVAETDIIQVKE